MFCLQVHAQGECTMNEKFSILHEDAGAECSKEILSSLYIQQGPVFVNKTRTLTVSNTFNI